MEYCQGGSLADRLKIAGRMPPAELVPTVAAVSEGLAELHRNGLIHRDVKPANILFASDRPKLADFGIAWSEGPREGDPLTLPGSTPGTVPYLAPEIAAGEPPSAASDVYALGVTVFQSLTGQYPQPSSAVGEADVDSRPVTLLPVSAAAPDLGPRFDAALARALDPDPAARPSAVELAAQLATALEVWGIARLNPGAIAAPYAGQGAPSGVDMQAPTRVAPERPSAAPAMVAAPRQSAAQKRAPRQPAARRPAPSRRVDWGGRAILVALLAVLAVLVLPRLLGGGGGGDLPAGSAGATATASATASAEASAEATATTSATALPSGERALFALDRVDAAIKAAGGGKDGLAKRDAKELEQLAASVRTAVDRGDMSAAATAARELSDQGRALTAGLDAARRDPLLAAIDGLVAALS